MTGRLTRADIEQILVLLEQSDFDELRLETEELKLHVRRSGGDGFEDAAENPPAAARPAASAAPVPVPAAAPSPASPAEGLVEVPAPMMGVFYRAPKPGAEPYVDVGSTIGPDTVVGILEVMKLMNPVIAGVAGEVVTVVAKDGALVEYGEPILRVRPS